MSVRTQRAFNFTREPFAKDFPVADLFLDEARSRTLETLQGAIEQRFSVLLTAEPGVGKSCLVRRLASQLHPGRFQVHYFHNATLGRRDFYRQLCWGLGLKPSATPAALFRALSQHIEELAAQNRGHPVFVLDEAHLLQDATVEILHLLLNYEWDSRPLLSLLLVGLPELKDRLRLHQHRALWTRLAERLHLGPFGPEGTAAYVRHRLAKAGCEREVFASDALARAIPATSTASLPSAWSMPHRPKSAWSIALWSATCSRLKPRNLPAPRPLTATGRWRAHASLMPTTRPLAIAPLPMPIASVHPIGFPLMAIGDEVELRTAA